MRSVLRTHREHIWARALAALLGSLALTAPAAALRVTLTSPRPAAAVSSPAAPTPATQLLTRLNAVRAAGASCGERGVRPPAGALRAAAPNARAAAQQAGYLASSGVVSHTGQGGSTPRQRAASAGIRVQAVAEIIYLGQLPGSERAVQWWLHEPLHCTVLLDPRFQEAGVSVLSGPGGTAYVVVFSGKAK